MKAIDKLKEITASLKSNGFGSAEREAELLISRGFNFTLLDIYKDNPDIDESCLESVEQMLERRLRHEPLQYIFGFEEFLGLDLAVGSGVLIPRPETELMAWKIIESIRTQNRKNKYRSVVSSQWSVATDNKQQTTDDNSSLSVLDVCTGSGCLALAVAKEFPDSYVIGVDISEQAIEYATKNAEINNIKNAFFLTGNLFEPIKELRSCLCSDISDLYTSPSGQTAGRHFTYDDSRSLLFDVIISNPPYIRSSEILSLQPEVRDWEPVTALDGGEDGLDLYRRLIPGASGFLKRNGLLILELGVGLAESVESIMLSSGYSDIEVIRDYAGIQRIIRARCRK